jgi:hypothetical protein
MRKWGFSICKQLEHQVATCTAGSLIRASFRCLDRSTATIACIRDAGARFAPHVAGFGLALALASRWFGWSWAVPAVYLGTAIAVLVATLMWGRRSIEVSDAAATDIDARGELGGELHSAHWFAAHKRLTSPVTTSRVSGPHSTCQVGKVAQGWPVVSTRACPGNGWPVAPCGRRGYVDRGPRSTATILAEQGLTAAIAGQARDASGRHPEDRRVARRHQSGELVPCGPVEVDEIRVA